MVLLFSKHENRSIGFSTKKQQLLLKLKKTKMKTKKEEMKKALNELVNAIDENTISMKDNEREELDLFITQRFIADELEQARRLLTK